MTNGTADLPSAIAGNTLPYPSAGALLQFIMPYLMSDPASGYTNLSPYWSPRRDWQLQATINNKEDMWAAAVAKTATKFAAHGFTIKDTQDSQRKVSAGQELMKRANGGEGWTLFAQKIIQDLLLTDNGVFIRIRRSGEETHKVKVKAKAAQDVAGGEPQTFDEAAVTVSPPGARITGLYHLDSLRCIRTGNLAYPVRYMSVLGQWQILRWDQVLMYADQPSARAELFGVGRCAADRSYNTISKIGAMERLDFEAITGGGANKLAFLQGINDGTLQGIIQSGQNAAQVKGWLYYLGTILGAIPGDTPINLVEVKLKELLDSFKPKEERDNAYMIYANNIGVAVQEIQPLSGQGMGTGTQTVILQEAAQGQGAMPTFIKWWEQTVSDRVLPATTELEFTDENDIRDQKARAEVQKTRADTRAVQIQSGEISPAMARQLAVDSEDLPREFIADDATAGGQISDDEKIAPEIHRINPTILSLIQSAPTTPPKQQGQPGMATKAAGHTGVMIALYPDQAAARQLVRLEGVTEPVEDLHLTLAFLGDSTEAALASNKERLLAAIKQWAAEKGRALKGTINGLGRFYNTESDGTNAVYVSLDVPGLPELRQSLVQTIEASGIEYAQNHGFTPHITVAYVPEADPTPDIRPDVPVAFGQVTVAWGDEHYAFPLGTGMTTKEIADFVARFRELHQEAARLGIEPIAWSPMKQFMPSLKDAADDLYESELGWARRLGREARKQ